MDTLRYLTLTLLCGTVTSGVGATERQTSGAADLPASRGQVLSISAVTSAPQILSGHLKTGTATNPRGRTYGVNSQYFTRDGQPWLPVMGEVHFSRVPREDWEDSILAMKAGGVQIVATYLFWIVHEESQGRYRWSGNRDVRAFVELCQKHGLLVWLRIGPWAHGEMKNGGFPDWLTQVCKPRTMDPAYFAQVRRWYGAVAEQTRGLMHKDGGPVIGIQFDNEFGHCGGEGGDAYILECKRIAREAGLDVCYYSVTGWGWAWVPKDEVLPLQASYIDGTWLGGTQRLPPPKELLFSGLLSLVRDTTVGEDLRTATARGQNLRYDPARYPFAMAEMGGGMEMCRWRRPIIPAIDTEAQALTRLGEGANLIGYYMYRGGSQPLGETGWLGQPECPQVTYDYQAPLGEFGTVHESYFRLKRLHQFLADFGEELAPLAPSLPTRHPAADDPAQLRYALRSDGTRGFLFFNNHQYHLVMHAQTQVQFAVHLKAGELLLPSRPVTIPPNAMGIWPLNLPVADATLIYASATPLMRFTNGGIEHLVFAATPGVPPEFLLTGLEGDGSKLSRPDLGKPFSFSTAKGARVQLLVVSHEDSYRAWTIRFGGKRALALCTAEIWQDGSSFTLRSRPEGALPIRIYPQTKQTLQFNGKPLKHRSEEGFACYRVETPGISVVAASFVSCPLPAAEKDYWYQPKFGAAHAWRIRMSGLDWSCAGDYRLCFRYLGDMACLYVNGHLAADDFWKSPEWFVALRRWRSELSNPDAEVVVVISPWKTGQDVFVETQPESREELTARIDSLVVEPVLRLNLQSP
jgi:beta-galactosidase